MTKKKPSRISVLEQRQKEIIYYLKGIKSQLDSTIVTLAEYIEFKKDRKEFEKYVNKKKKKVDEVKK